MKIIKSKRPAPHTTKVFQEQLQKAKMGILAPEILRKLDTAEIQIMNVCNSARFAACFQAAYKAGALAANPEYSIEEKESNENMRSKFNEFFKIKPNG